MIPDTPSPDEQLRLDCITQAVLGVERISQAVRTAAIRLGVLPKNPIGTSIQSGDGIQ